MNGIAFFMDNSSISYTAIYVVFGAVTALICSLLTARFYRFRITPVLATAAVSMVTATLCSRIVYWYCCPERFDGLWTVIADFSSGGFSLVGAIVGVLIAAVIVKAVHICNDFAALMDCLAPGAALGIAVGRLGGFFSNDDKGNFIFTEDRFQKLPFSVPVQDSVTGSVEWRFASFFWESMAGFAIFVILLIIILIQPSKLAYQRKGDVFMAFLSMYGATQATLESTRYDALHMRSNGFISMMQMTAMIMILTPLVYYSVKILRNNRSSRSVRTSDVVSVIIFDLISVAAIAGAGVAEYFVQRKAKMAMTIYPIQISSLIVACIMTLLLAIHLHRAPKFGSRKKRYR